MRDFSFHGSVQLVNLKKGETAQRFFNSGFQLFHLSTPCESAHAGDVTNMIFFLFKLRVVIPDVSILPEDLEELYDLFKVGLPEKQGMHLIEASLGVIPAAAWQCSTDLPTSAWAMHPGWDLAILSFLWLHSC